MKRDGHCNSAITSSFHLFLLTFFFSSEIGELLCMKSKYGPGGEFEPDWYLLLSFYCLSFFLIPSSCRTPPGPPPAPQLPTDPPIPDPIDPLIITLLGVIIILERRKRGNQSSSCTCICSTPTTAEIFWVFSIFSYSGCCLHLFFTLFNYFPAYP